MTNKDLYMIAYNILNDLSGMEGSRMTNEEGEAVKTTMNVLARNFTNETMWDIRFCMGEENSSPYTARNSGLVSMKDALKAVKMAKGENVRRLEPMKGIPRIQVKDLSDKTEEEAIAFIDSLGAIGYNTSSLRNEYKRTKHITI